jgi:hypothetical protein
MNCLTHANCELDAIDCSSLMPMRRASRGAAAPTADLWWTITVALIVWISSGLLEARLVTAQDVPNGTIELSGGSLAAGIGYTWGTGRLVYEGKEYPLKLDGLSLLNVGLSSYTASGAVYNLTKLSDINGTYTSASEGSKGTIAGGAPTVTMKNPQGVLIQMTTTHQGVAFNLGPNGVTLSMQQ